MNNKKVRKIIEEWYPKFIDGSNCPCEECRSIRIEGMLSAIEAHYKSRRLSETEMVKAMINMGYGLPSSEEEQKYKDIAHVIFKAQRGEG